eukprot:gene8106-16643_t
MSSADTTLPDFFPTSTKQCKASADAFFSCFSLKSKKSDEKDTQAGVKGVLSCLKEKKEYEKCMVAFEKKNAPKRYRVQEEYRKSSKIENKPSTS